MKPKSVSYKKKTCTCSENYLAIEGNFPRGMFSDNKYFFILIFYFLT